MTVDGELNYACNKKLSERLFFIDKEAEPDNIKITSLKHVLKAANDEELANLKRAPIIRASWRLKVAKAPGYTASC